MPRKFVCSLAFVLLAGSAAAGPWPREEGGTFLALQTERDRKGNSYSGLYGEYGWSARNTLGVELGHTNQGETSALLWLQRALDDSDGPDRWAVSLGAGAIERDGSTMPLLQIGGAWGRGLDSIPVLERISGGGWLAAEARVKLAGAMKDEAEFENLAASGAGLLSYLTPETTAKAEVTLGWHATDLLMLINQLQLEERGDTGFSSKLAVSVVHDLTGASKLQLGLNAPLSGSGETVLKMGTWLKF